MVAAAALMVLGAGAYFAIRAPQTGLPPTGSVPTLRLENGSGAQVGICYDNGNCRFSGSLVTQGAETVASLTVTGTASGNVIHAEKTLTSSGTLKVVGATTFSETASGNRLHVEKDLTSSGTLKVVGDSVIKGSASGGTTFINGAPAGQALCKLPSGAIGQCTSVVGAGGGCTCS